MKSKMSSALAGLAILSLASLGLAGCGTVGGGSEQVDASLPAHMVPTKEGKLKVGFSNSFAGNAFRAQMIHELNAEVERQKTAGAVESIKVTNADNSVDKQISDINDLITSGIDILLINAASETALNSAVERAHKQGILVVSFDNTVSSPNGIKIGVSNVEFGKVGAEWLVKKLQKGDSVFTLDGVAGSPVSEDRLKGAKPILEAAGVSIVGGTPTDWDQAKGKSAAADLLAANPGVKGVYSQGGATTLGAIKAMEERGQEILPISGEGFNGFLKKWKELKDKSGWESIAPCSPPSIAADALKVAIKAATGTDPGQVVELKLPVITQDTLEKFVRTDLPDDFFLPTGMSDEEIKAYFAQGTK